MISLLSKQAQAALEKLGAISGDGYRFFKGQYGKLNLLISSDAQSSPELERDETHYFLIPDQRQPESYSLYVKRVLPQGIAPVNDLPKVKIFQLPGSAMETKLLELLQESLSAERQATLDPQSPMADRLEAIAEEIDKKSNFVTGGIIVIGGVVAVANPLLGIGIAAKAIFPSVGATLSKHGLNHVSDWLKQKSKLKQQTKASNQVAQQLKNLKPEIRVNPLLELLETCFTTNDPDHDPSLASLSLFSTKTQSLQSLTTIEAIKSVYSDGFDQLSDSNLNPAERDWLASLLHFTPQS